MRRRTMASVGVKPYDEKLEYIITNGNQYVDTLYYLNESSVINTNLYFTSSTTQQMGVGRSNTSVNALLVTFINNHIAISYSTSQSFKTTSIGGASWADITLDVANNMLYANTESMVCVYGNFNNRPSWGMFARNNDSGQSAYCSCYCKNFTASEDGIEVVNMIPVLKSGVAYLYDTVRKKMFSNAISGHTFGYCKKDGTVVAPT